MGSIWLGTFKKLNDIESGIKEQLYKRDIVLGVGEMHILMELYQSDKQKPSALARSVGRAATSFTPTLDRLEKEGLIERQLHPSDRRAVLICLTRNGLALKDTIIGILAECEKRYGSKK